jgi:hypothetical protein
MSTSTANHARSESGCSGVRYTLDAAARSGNPCLVDLLDGY